MKWTAMDKGFLLIVMEVSIQMCVEDLVLPLCSVPAAWAEDKHNNLNNLTRIIDPTVDLLFMIPYNVVQEVISSFSKNDNTVQLGDKRTKIYAKNAHTQNA